MSLKEIQESIVEEFSMFSEWLEKYEYLIELGRELKSYPEEKKTEDRLIKGCQSRVWLDYEVREGKIYFTADSDAIITKGIISLLIKVYSGRSPQEILEDDFSFIDEIGLKQNLSPTRANGLISMISTIKAVATAEVAENNESAEAQDEGSESQKEDKKSDAEVLTAEDAKALATVYSNVILALRQVYDPEIPVNIYDLGLVYEININKKREVQITMTFTAPNCPMADQVLAEVHSSVSDVPEVTKVEIELVFEPEWDRSMLSEEARIELGLD